jgi:hypothetical protein
MTENLLQYIWQHQLLEGSLHTADGQEVLVERPGLLNTDAGPDFFDARVRIGETLWVGNIEVHVLASDWNRHHHSNNRAYDNVVLHVVYDNDTPVTLQNCHTLPTIELKKYIPDLVLNNYEALVSPPTTVAIPCADRLAAVPKLYLDSTLDRLLLERLERKCDTVQRLLDESHGNWEQCCYWLLAHYFGGKTNSFPFELLAKSTDMNLLARWRDRPQRLEALLMGQAGLLQGYFADEYPRQLQADYEALRQGAGLTPVSAHLWKFFRLRPYAFPTIRISQFSQLVCRSASLFSRLLETTSADSLRQLFTLTASPYWDNHYRFDSPSPGKPKRTGAQFTQSLIINAWVPLLFLYGSQHAQQSLKDRAVDLLQQLPPEDNRIVRLYRSAGIEPSHAAHTQALLQLHHGYCSPRNCLNCHIGYKIIQH